MMHCAAPLALAALSRAGPRQSKGKLMLNISCPNCARTIFVPEAYVGRTVKCPKCLGRIDGVIAMFQIDNDKARTK